MPVGPFDSFEECVQTLLDENPDLTEEEARRICGDMEQDSMTRETKTVTKSAGGIITREDDDGDEMRLLEVPISSTNPDRDGDEFSEEALVRMRDQIRRDRPLVFLNHGFTAFEKPLYDARDTVGTLMDAKITEAKNNQNSEEKDLVAHINPDTTHPEGQRMLDQVEDGQAIKFSVGFRVLDAEAKDPENEESDARIFKNVDLMETSKVGIPANPDATAEVAAKAAGLTEQLAEAGVDISDDEAFAKALASELVSKGKVTSETVQEATPVQYDGEAQHTERRSATPTDAKAPEDIDFQELAEFMASHLDGADPSDITGLTDQFDYVGAVDVPELATLVGDVVDEDTGTVQDQFDEWMGTEESERYLMTDDAQERLDHLESEVQAIHEKLDEALGGDPEPDTDDQDGAQTGADDPPETFAVDGEEYAPDDIRDLRERAEAADAEDATTQAGAPDPEETDDADTASDSDADDGGTKSLRQTVHQ